jgi:hypothetical protein
MTNQKPILNISRKSLTTWLSLISIGLFLMILGIAFSDNQEQREYENRPLKKSEAWEHAEQTAIETLTIIEPTAQITDLSGSMETVFEKVDDSVRIQGWIQYRRPGDQLNNTYQRAYHAVMYRANDSIFYTSFKVGELPRLGIMTKPPF